MNRWPTLMWGLLVLAGLLPVCVLGIYSFRVNSESVRAAVQSNNRVAARMAAEVVGREFENCAGIAEAASRSPSLIQAVARHDEQATRDEMEIIVTSYPRINRANVVDPAGALWADFPRAPETYLQNYAYRDYFQGVIQQPKSKGFKEFVPYVSEVFRRVAAPQPLVVTASTAIHDQQMKLLGILVCHYRLETLTDWLKDCVVGESGYVFVLDHRGQVAAHPKIDLQTAEHLEYSRLSAVRAAMAGNPSTVEYEDPVVHRLMVATFWPVRVSGNNWVVIAQQPENEAYAPIRHSQMQLAMVTSILALSAIAVVVVMGRIEHQLRNAKEAAEGANRAKSAFLANMSHEIRTPLNAIIGMTELMMKSQLSAPHRSFLRTVREAGDALLSLIDDVLDFSKIEAERLELESEPFDLWESLGQTMNSFSVRAHQRGLKLTYSIHGNVPRTVVGDYRRLRQVILNLVGNAVKFTEKGAVGVEAAVESRSDRDVLLHFTVRDTGVGIAPEKQATIFEMFEQADNSITRRYGGTGLGLAIASGLISRMGGRIWVESEVGRGSQFHFLARLALPEAGASDAATGRPSEIRLFEVEIPPEVAPVEEPPVSTAKASRRNGLRVLLAEDSLVNQKLAVALLEGEGYDVHVVNNGLAAVVLAQGGGFDVVLMDVQMPEMDGLEATRRIRAWEKETGSHLPIIAMTAHAIKGDRETCLEAGMDEYISKPIHAEDLFAAVQSVCRSGQG